MRTVTSKQNMRHICVRGKQVRSTTEIFNSIIYKAKNIVHSYKRYCDNCMFKNEWSLHEY